ncbi:MAG: hypothetical protein ACJAWT_000371 [Glaciecola sp.]|jgi:hypothetical protein
MYRVLLLLYVTIYLKDSCLNMWRAFVVFIEIVILVIVLRTSFVQYFLSDIQQTVSGWIEAVVDIPEQQSLSVLREKFFYNNMLLQPHQTDYVLDITESREKLESFRQFYCVKKDKNPFIYGQNLTRLCNQIQSTKF